MATEHTVEVLREAGIPDARIEQWLRDGVIRPADSQP